MGGRAFRVLTWSLNRTCVSPDSDMHGKSSLYINVSSYAARALVRIFHVLQVAVVFRGAPALVRLVSRRAFLGWETLGKLLTLRPGWTYKSPPQGCTVEQVNLVSGDSLRSCSLP